MEKPQERACDEHQIHLELESKESSRADYGCRTECTCYNPTALEAVCTTRLGAGGDEEKATTEPSLT